MFLKGPINISWLLVVAFGIHAVFIDFLFVHERFCRIAEIWWLNFIGKFKVQCRVPDLKAFSMLATVRPPTIPHSSH